MNKSTILFIGKRYYTNRDALNEKFGRIYQLPCHWSRAGLNVKLWLIDYHGSKIDRLQHGGLHVISTPIRGAQWIKMWIGLAVKRFSSQRTTHIVASGDCYIGLMAWLLSWFLGAKLIFDVYDKYDEFSGYRRLLGFDVFHFLLTNADYCLFASQKLLRTLCKSRNTNILVPNGVDLERFRPYDKEEARLRLGLPANRIYIGYFGSMEPDRGVDDLIDAVLLLRQSGREIELILGGRKRENLHIPESGVRYLGNIPFENVPLALASCNALAIPYRRSSFMDAGASNKIAEAVACRRPLIATNTPNFVDNFPDQARCLADRLAEPAQTKDLARVIALQLDEPILVSMPAGMNWDFIAVSTSQQMGIAN